MILLTNQHTIFSGVVVSFRLVIVTVTSLTNKNRRRPGFNSLLKRLLFCHLLTFCAFVPASSPETCVMKQQMPFILFAKASLSL